MATPPKNRPIPPRRDTLLAKADIERLGLNPIEMLAEVYRLAIEGYKAGRGMTDKVDSGAAWLAVARQAANDLCSYKHPKLSAVAVKDIRDPASERPPITTAEAVKILESDPFKVSTADVVEQMKNTIHAPALPTGEKNE